MIPEMDTVAPCSAAWWCTRDVVRRMARLVPLLCALAGIAAAPVDSKILFARGTDVPRSAQVFAWRVIERHCNYQAYERELRTFWAFDTRVRSVGPDLVYSISILSELSWRKTEPPAIIEMTLVDDGRLRLATLSSSFVDCAPPHS